MSNQPLQLFSIFHLNLAYSSIEEEQRPEVVNRCYWPLLRLASEYNLPFGIEASAYTLEAIASFDPVWLAELRRLTTEGPCEFIGSGYAQIIGPLVPAEVNAANLRIGHQVYEQLLGLRPQIALVNEQAYSAGLIEHYLNAGYRAIIMEWDNPFRCHREWDPKWRYLPQIACGQHAEEIALIWSKSIAFQKFQRYVHGEMELDDYFGYLYQHLANEPRAFSLYSNDIEVFDFRPGRYHTEAVLQEESEWLRIERLYKRLRADDRLQLIPPRQVLELIDLPGAGNRLSLESPDQPVPVKKQGKYNVTRWAVTGRNDLGINTACWRIYEAMRNNPKTIDDDWRELCYLLSSDFRTHITELRWQKYCERLRNLQERVDALSLLQPNETQMVSRSMSVGEMPNIKQDGRYLIIETKSVRVRLNTRRGMAIDGLWLGNLDGPPLCATLPHGYYDDISLGADWYTGHVILETFGQPKVTDLNPVVPEIARIEESGDIVINGVVPTPLGPVSKRILVSASEPVLELSYEFNWEETPMGTFRLGNVTLNPYALDRSTLYYRTCNGGKSEMFSLNGTSVGHGSAVSFLVSANCGLGITDGWIELGDKNHCLRIDVDKSESAMIGLISYREVGDDYFCRLAFSAGEMDETRRIAANSKPDKLRSKLRFTHSTPSSWTPLSR